MVYPVTVTDTCGLVTFFVILGCVRLVSSPGGCRLPLSWCSRKDAGRPERRTANRQVLPGVTVHISDGIGYWRGSLVDVSEMGFCLEFEEAEAFFACQGMFGLLLEKEGNCLPVRVALKWRREMPGRMCIGLAVDDHYWNWQKFQEKICRVRPAVIQEH